MKIFKRTGKKQTAQPVGNEHDIKRNPNPDTFGVLFFHRLNLQEMA